MVAGTNRVPYILARREVLLGLTTAWLSGDHVHGTPCSWGHVYILKSYICTHVHELLRLVVAPTRYISSSRRPTEIYIHRWIFSGAGIYKIL